MHKSALTTGNINQTIRHHGGRIAVAALLMLLYAACLPAPHYQKNEAIPNNAWDYNLRPKFTFDITDSTAVYQPYFIIRHTQAYPYNNIWMWLYIKTPGDTVATKARINIVLAEPTGRWLGRGMGEIYEQRMPISLGDSVNLSKPGTYTIEMEQNMRINPLPDVLHVGLRVEKAVPQGMQ
jgi:gliding motility-associated lipoprotein GldH